MLLIRLKRVRITFRPSLKISNKFLRFPTTQLSKSTSKKGVTKLKAQVIRIKEKVPQQQIIAKRILRRPKENLRNRI
jgi:hypothetical protein